MTEPTLLFTALAIKSIYLPLNRRQSKYYWKLKIDDLVPLVPIFIIPYLGYFFLDVISIFLLWGSPLVRWFLVSHIVSYAVAGTFWYFFPNGVARPEIIKQDILSRLTKLIHRYDHDTNGFPSAHVFSTIICCYFLSLVLPGSILLIWGTAALIIASTLLVKQHHVLDILGGLTVSVLSIVISTQLL